MTTYLPDEVPIPVPLPDGLDEPFHTGLAAHRLMIPRCPSCATWQFPVEVLCYKCRTFGLEWDEVTPLTGVVHAWTRIWHPVRPYLASAVPYIALLVELPQAGGVRLVGNLLGDGRQEVHCGDAVTGVFEDHPSDPPFTLLQWKHA